MFGCVAHVKVTKPNLAKLEDRSIPMVLLGYEPGSAAYRVYDPVRNRVHVSRDIVFDEGARWDWDKAGEEREAGPFQVEVFVHTTAHAAKNPAGRHSTPDSAAGATQTPQDAVATPRSGGVHSQLQHSRGTTPRSAPIFSPTPAGVDEEDAAPPRQP